MPYPQSPTPHPSCSPIQTQPLGPGLLRATPPPSEPTPWPCSPTPPTKQRERRKRKNVETNEVPRGLDTLSERAFLLFNEFLMEFLFSKKSKKKKISRVNHRRHVRECVVQDHTRYEDMVRKEKRPDDGERASSDSRGHGLDGP